LEEEDIRLPETRGKNADNEKEGGRSAEGERGSLKNYVKERKLARKGRTGTNHGLKKEGISLKKTRPNKGSGVRDTSNRDKKADRRLDTQSGRVNKALVKEKKPAFGGT